MTVPPCCMATWSVFDVSSANGQTSNGQTSNGRTNWVRRITYLAHFGRLNLMSSRMSRWMHQHRSGGKDCRHSRIGWWALTSQKFALLSDSPIEANQTHFMERSHGASGMQWRWVRREHRHALGSIVLLADLGRDMLDK